MTVFHTARVTLPRVWVFFCHGGMWPALRIVSEASLSTSNSLVSTFSAEAFSWARRESCCARLFEHESARYLSRRRHCHYMVLHLNENFKNSSRKRSWKVKMRPKPHGEFIRWCEFWGGTKSDVSFSLNAWIQSLMAHQQWLGPTRRIIWWASAGLLFSNPTLVPNVKEKPQQESEQHEQSHHSELTLATVLLWLENASRLSEESHEPCLCFP